MAYKKQLRRSADNRCCLGLSVLFIAALIGCGDGSSSPVMLDSVAVHDRSGVDERKSLLLREGGDADGIVIAEISRSFTEVELKVVEGPARFAGGTDTVKVTSDGEGAVRLPRMVATEPHLDALVRVASSGAELGVLRVRYIAAQRWERLEELLVQHPEALLRRGEGFVAIDESVIAAHADDRGERFSSASDGSGAKEEQTIEKQAVCLRSFVGPGQVLWRIPEPFAAYGFSVKTETQWPLVPAQISWQDIDGVYNREWGCRRAWKVPDSCTYTVWQAGNGTQGECCCNAAAAAVGNYCRWVDTGAADVQWPLCPL